MSVTWVDFGILIVVLYYIYSGWERGFATILAELLSFLLSFWLAVRFHTVVGSIIATKFGIPETWTSIIGYLSIAFLTEMLFDQLFVLGLSRLPNNLLASNVNKALGSIASAINGLIIISFILLVTLALPLRGTIKSDIQGSTLASSLVRLSEAYGGQVTSSLETAAKRAASFLTIEPDSNEQLPLDIPSGLTLTVDAKDETAMINLVNHERTSRGLRALTIDSRMTELARAKSKDMFVRKYFSHYDPDGKNAADHMEEADVPFQVVGENLAYAPDLSSAHDGLMKSPGHRANILDSRYGRIGIGIIDSVSYGKMFTQLFAN